MLPTYYVAEDLSSKSLKLELLNYALKPIEIQGFYLPLGMSRSTCAR